MRFKEIRCHPVIILSELGSMLPVVAFSLLSFFMEEDAPTKDTNAVPLVALILIAIGGVFALFRYFAWKRTFISLTEDSFIYNKQTKIFRKNVRVRLSQISTVNLNKTVFDRIFGTYTVKLDINSSKTAEKTDFHLVFDSDIAKELADRIMLWKKGDTAAEAIDLGLEGAFCSRPVLRLTLSNIIAHSILSISVISLIVVGACFGGLLIPFFETGKYIALLLPILGLPMAVLGLFLFNTLRWVLYYYDFTVFKNHNEITVSFGLITRRTLKLPTDKTNGVIIKQTFLSRLFGKYYAEIINVGGVEGDFKGAHKLFLMTNKETARRLLLELVPDFAGDFDLPKSPKRAIIPIFFKGLIIALPATAAVFGGFFAFELTLKELYIGLAAVFVTLALATFLGFAAKGLKTENNRLVISDGVFAKRIITLPFNKVQSVRVKKGPVSGPLGLCKGEVNILSSSLNRVNKIGYFPPEKFEKIMENTEKTAVF